MFWNNLNALCAKQGISVSKLCSELDLSNSISTKWKKGAVPNNSTLKKIADYFGVSVDYLLGKESNTEDLPEQDKKVLSMLHSLNEEGKEKAEQYLELLSLQYKSDKDKVAEIMHSLPDKKDNTVTARIAAFGGGVREVKLSKDDLREIVNMLEKKEKE